MIPAAYVHLPSLPLSPSGKLDRKALPPPDDDAFARQEYQAPQGEMEKKLADIWRNLLNIQRISRHDNFFALGGHSLLAVQLLAQLRQTGLDTTVKQVFDAPTLAALASNLARYNAIKIPHNLLTKDSTEITPEMLPLIDLSQADIDVIISQVPGGVANIQEIYGLTPLQNGMLFHHLMAEESDPYLIASQVRFIDRTSLERYANAMQQLIERHDILRTAIHWDGLSEAAQVVLRQVTSFLTDITLNESHESVLEQLSQEYGPHCHRLDLTQAPLLRLISAPESDESWAALQLTHHLIVDAATEQRMHSELCAIMNGATEALIKATPFREFVAKTRLGTSADDHKGFFTKMLGDIDEPTLPFGLSDVDRDASEVNDAYLELLQALIDQIRVHARNMRVSLASVCHLAWAQVVAKISGRESVVFGTVLLGRLQEGEGNTNIMGPMINTLPLRLDIDERSVEIVVRDTHARLSALLSHEHAPLVLAQRCSGVPTGLPLFNSLLNCRHNQKLDERNMSLPGVSFVDDDGRTNYPLTMSMDDDDNSLSLSAQVKSPISAERIVVYMQQSLKSLADALARTPHQAARKLEMMSSEERNLLLHRWNQVIAAHSSISCLHQLFEVQVECEGQSTAVECNGSTLTYSELSIRANRLAHYLISQGVRPDDRIALCVERSRTMIVAMLGILKAGCAYVPLDPVYSSKRLTNILIDSDPIFLLADIIGRRTLEDHNIKVIELEKDLPSDLTAENPDATKHGLTSTNLAYIIYTSGSTGLPKGIMVEHRQVVPLFEDNRNKFGFNKLDHWCSFHSMSFDVSIWETFGALLYGCHLSIPPHNITRSMDELYDWVCVNHITVLEQTSSTFKIFIRSVNIDARRDRLRLVIFGGEAFDPTIVTEWYEKYDDGRTILVNMYGPTEAVITATTWICDIGTSRDSISPIGRPLLSKRVYLLNKRGKPVPFGASGEIYIGGAGVARGYLNRPELTAQRFLPDPFCNDSTEARMYRTGDLARYQPDGNLVFLGRADQQVKIRGFRIELGEIEARLVEHPQVNMATVQCFGSGSDARLVAYVVADQDASLAHELRTYLSSLLPDYMIPAAYVCLPSLPLSPSGKLDRKALPPPDDDAFARQEYEAPQGEMEEKLADIWRNLLNIQRISRHDNFFALGGHSLLVVRALAQLRQTGLDTTVKQVFDASTLAVLASSLARYNAINIPNNLITKDSTEITPEMLPLIDLSQADIDVIISQVPGGVTNIQDIYGLTPLQHGMLFHHMMTAKDRDPYLIASQVRYIDRTSLESYANAMQQLIQRHDILRTAIIWDGLSEAAQVVLRQVTSFLTDITLIESHESALEQLCREFGPHRRHLDLKQAPLVRLISAPESDGSWVALQLTHHLITDAATEQRMHSELCAIMNGATETLITPTPFREFVAKTRLGTRPDDHKRFFTEMLGDIDEPTLPFGLSDVDRDASEVNDAYLELSQTLIEQIRVHARNMHVSLASVCHLAWAQVVAKISGRESVVFGTVLLGRLQEGEGNTNIMGPMINTLPLRLDIDERSVEVVVRDTHARLSALLSHEHAPLVLAQRCSGVPTGLPLFNSLLNCRHSQKLDERNMSLPGISFVDDDGRTNYPLTISMDDDDNSLSLSAQVVSPISAERIGDYIQQSLKSLADALAETPHQATKKLDVMPSEERNLLLHSWNQVTAAHSSNSCLHQLFEVQVECDGQSTAVLC